MKRNCYLYPYQTATVFCEGKEIGYLGRISYGVMKDEDMRFPGYVMELDLAALYEYYGKAKVFQPLPKYATDKRDLALIMDKTVTCGQVEKVIASACPFVTDVVLFDVYEGAPIPEDKRSMAFTVTFTPKEEEFGKDTVDGYVKKVLKNLKHHLDIDLRS